MKKEKVERLLRFINRAKAQIGAGNSVAATAELDMAIKILLEAIESLQKGES